MTRPTLPTVLILAALGGMPASAQTRSGFKVGLQGLDYSYRERIEGTTVVRDDGPMAGLTLDYVETIGREWFLRAHADAANGKIDYRSDDGAKLDNVDQTIGQIELHLGHDFVSTGGTTLTAFAGVGVRGLRDESGGRTASDGALGYDRRVAYAYVPVGLAVRMPTGARSSLSLSGQYDHVFRGRANSKLSAVQPNIPDLTLAANRGHGFEAAAALSLPLGRHLVAIGPFVREWRIRQSNCIDIAVPEGVVTFFEPGNRTREVGLRIALGF